MISPIQERLDFLLPELDEKSHIVDLGCGTGLLAKELYTKRKMKLIGIDLDRDNIALARRNCPQNTYKVMDVTKARFTADIFIISEVLEHLSHPGALLKGMRKNVKGKILVTIPNGYGPWELIENQPLEFMRDFVKKRPKCRKRYYRLRDALGAGANDSKNDDEGSRHLQRFTTASFRKMTEKAGYRIVKRRNIHVFACLFPLRVLRRKLPFIQSIDRFFCKITPACLASGWGFVLVPR